MRPELRIRPEVAATIDSRDTLRRTNPRHLSGIKLFGIMVRAGMPHRLVPPEFWTLDVTDDGYSVAVVACPCGFTPCVELCAAPHSCECQRGFFYDGNEVWALNSPEAKK